MWWVGSRCPAVASAAAALVFSSLFTVVTAVGSVGAAHAVTAAPGPTVQGPPDAVVGRSSTSGTVITNDIRLHLEEDGVLLGQETVTFEGGTPTTFTRALTETMLYDTEHDRVFEVHGIGAADGAGEDLAVETEKAGGTLYAHISTGGAETVVLRYRVRGAVSQVAQGVQLEWRAVGAYSHTVQSTDVTVTAQMPPEGLSCLAGEPRSALYCTASDMGADTAVAHFLQADMRPRDRLDIAVTYPPGTAEGEPILNRRWSLASAFQVTPWTAGVFGLLLVVLVGGLVVLIRVRGRDERALREEAARGDQAPVTTGEHGRARFEPPDGVHPGQIGTLFNETVDITDLTGAVVDLAVRGYIRLEELPHEHFTSVDWRLVRLDGPPGESLRPYEWLLLDALFAERRTVRLSQVGTARVCSDFPARMDRVREELYRDMVRLRWFARSPNQVRGRWSTTGMAITALGVLLTVLLAMFTTAAFTGLAVVIAGAAITVAAQYMPAKTRLGSSVLAHTIGFRDYLLSQRSATERPGERVEIYSRYLPYAVIFDDVDRWANILASAALTDLTDEELTGDGLAWYTGPQEWRIEDFADSIRTFAVTLTGIITNARRMRLVNQFQRRR
ncbi:hypothetical protein BJF83_16365 [Nocardiopsis sp. CNR-923]|uniref:DUF2207 domain-containing protein n=1 Tax=Nocardiopsis sp. CNR-923 TaxID=1904965 RepID=UPI000968A58F|nr:DUF2207 domain-containing protein [Nocardiopsis sp. CNR-923]OLT28009.1 hypothetical protein BJF83_16365 [Nocardiopsis sp. CNR-923]